MEDFNPRFNLEAERDHHLEGGEPRVTVWRKMVCAVRKILPRRWRTGTVIPVRHLAVTFAVGAFGACVQLAAGGG